MPEKKGNKVPTSPALERKKGKEKEVERIFEKWDLHAVKIGEVTRGDKYRVLDGGKMAAEIPAKALADDTANKKRFGEIFGQ